MSTKYRIITEKFRVLVSQISRNQQFLDEVRELDRQLAKLPARERFLGQRLFFLKSSEVGEPPSEFEWIIQEIQA